MKTLLVAIVVVLAAITAGTARANSGQPVCKQVQTAAGYYKTVVVTPAYYSKKLVARAHYLKRNGHRVKWTRKYHRPKYSKKHGWVWVNAVYTKIYHPAVTNQVWVPPVYETQCLPVWTPPTGYAMWTGSGTYDAPGYPGYNQGIGEQDTPRSSGGCTYDTSGLSDAQYNVSYDQGQLAAAIASGDTQQIAYWQNQLQLDEGWLHSGAFTVGCWGVNIDTQMGCSQGLFVTVNEYGADGSTYVDYDIEEIPVVAPNTVVHLTGQIWNNNLFWTGDTGPVGSWQVVKIDCFNY